MAGLLDHVQSDSHRLTTDSRLDDECSRNTVTFSVSQPQNLASSSVEICDRNDIRLTSSLSDTPTHFELQHAPHTCHLLLTARVSTRWALVETLSPAPSKILLTNDMRMMMWTFAGRWREVSPCHVCTWQSRCKRGDKHEPAARQTSNGAASWPHKGTGTAFYAIHVRNPVSF